MTSNHTDLLAKLCEGLPEQEQRRIRIAYYLGLAAGLRAPRQPPGNYVPSLLKYQAD